MELAGQEDEGQALENGEATAGQDGQAQGAVIGRGPLGAGASSTKIGDRKMDT